MSEKQETIADIVAEMRSLVEPGETLEHTYELLNGLAVRIEATQKRDIGNIAKMREVLEEIGRKVIAIIPRSSIQKRTIDNVKRLAQAALAEPKRNCDVYNSETCRMAYHMKGPGLMTMQAFADWIFAPYEEGGAK